jgi:uncharacterized protein DUF4145
LAQLVDDCPRCDARTTTFDVLATTEVLRVEYGWQAWREAFCVCRNCSQATVFHIADRETDSSELIRAAHGLDKIPGSATSYVNVEGFVSLKDEAHARAPEHTPPDIDAVFAEGATCLAVRCFNAAGVMFRTCVDLATRKLLPDGEAEGLNARVRRDLGLRLPWLFEHGLLPSDLKDLSTCIREDGNDGAHQATLTEHDAEDLLDFTNRLLERLYTVPGRLKMSEQRREKRRAKKKS